MIDSYITARIRLLREQYQQATNPKACNLLKGGIKELGDLLAVLPTLSRITEDTCYQCGAHASMKDGDALLMCATCWKTEHGGNNPRRLELVK